MKNIKKINIIITICLLIGVQNAQAQWWSLTGNTIGTNTNWLGTFDAKPLDIKTNNLNRLYIDGNGKIGINTTVPLATLHINHYANALVNATAFTVRYTTANTALTNTEFSALTHKGIPTIGGNGFTALYVKRGNNAQTTAGYFDGKVVVQGLVGIGTNAPEGTLQVGAQMPKIVMGSAEGQNTGWGAGYIGFNASRQNASSWSTSTDGSHNGAGIIYTNVVGDMMFSTLPHVGTGVTGQTGILDAAIVANTRLFIGNNGNIGIATKGPTERLQIDGGNVLIKGINNFANVPDVATLYLGDYNHFIRTKRGTGVSINTYTYTGSTLQPEALGIFLQEPTGNVGIGTDLQSNQYNGTPNYFKLSVLGPIRTTAVVVETGWADFVFDKNYPLMPLKEVEKYINEKGHLPNIPSTQEIEKKGGADVGELLKLQMQKIEELTLYLIEQDKKMQQMQQELKALKAAKPVKEKE